MEKHHSKKSNSIINITSKFNNIRIDIIQFNRISEEMVIINAKMIFSYKIKNQVSPSASFNKNREDGEMILQIELTFTSSQTENLTQPETDNINIQWTLENRIQRIEMPESGINSMKTFFFKTGEINESLYVKLPLRTSALLDLKIDDKYCFNWSILAHLHPWKRNKPTKASNHKQYFGEVNIEGFEFSDGFKGSDVHKFEKFIV